MSRVKDEREGRAGEKLLVNEDVALAVLLWALRLRGISHLGNMLIMTHPAVTAPQLFLRLLRGQRVKRRLEARECDVEQELTRRYRSS